MVTAIIFHPHRLIFKSLCDAHFDKPRVGGMTAASLVPSASALLFQEVLNNHLRAGDPPRLSSSSQLSKPNSLHHSLWVCAYNLDLCALRASPPSLCSGIDDSRNGHGDFCGEQLRGQSPVLEVLLGKPTEVPWTCLWITGWLKGFQTPTMNFSF